MESKVGKVEDKPDKESFISDYVNRREYMNMTDSLSNLYDKYFTAFQQKLTGITNSYNALDTEYRRVLRKVQELEAEITRLKDEKAS